LTRPVVLAIDGPAGAGKSTVAERLARELCYFNFDTGVLYRAIAVRCLDLGANLDDEAALGEIVASCNILVRPSTVDDGRQVDVLVEGRDVSHEIRTPRVDAVVSRVAASPAVRAGLIDLQRRQIQGKGTIMAGRDIGTVVCPDADLKIFLTASSAERAQRRLTQVGGSPDELEAIQQAIDERDQRDSSRAISPLMAAEDAVELDTDGKSIEAVVAIIRALLDERLAERAGAGRGNPSAEASA
jgi:cytidylate kinase